jgi:ComF family protein
MTHSASRCGIVLLMNSTSVTATMHDVWTLALDLLLPRVCVVCEDLLAGERGLVCTACWRAIQRLPEPLCDRCGHPTYGNDCQWCPLLPAFVVRARSVCWVPEGTGGELVHQLKYSGWTGLARELAAEMSAPGMVWPQTARAVLLPVPLGAARQRERGYNQSAEIARWLGRKWGIRVMTAAVVRARETSSQVRLTPEERSANVHGAFTVGPEGNALRGTHAVLVDDVVTTAATLNACAAAAIAAGARSISYITFGRARAAFDRTSHPRSAPRWQSASASTASAALAARSFAPRKNAASTTSTSSRSMT